MKILVTGGCGFIGRHLVTRLVDDDHHVVVFDRVSHWPHQRRGCSFFLGDVRDRDAVFEAVNSCDRWVNLAGLLGTSEMIRNPFPAVDANVLGALNCFEAARVHGRTGLQIAVGNHWMNNPYSITKSTAERFALTYNRELDTDIRIVRAMNVYGPTQRHKPVRKLFPNIVIPALRNEPITIYGDGTQIMDMMYVRDACEVLARCLLADDLPVNQIYQAGAGPITVNEVVALVVELTQSRSPIIKVPMRPGEEPNAVVQIDERGWEQLREHLNYTPQDLTDMRTAFGHTIQWYQEHLEEFV